MGNHAIAKNLDIDKKRFHLIACVIIVLVGLLIYSNSLHSSFQFDDHRTIVLNPFIRDLSNLPLFFQQNGFTSSTRGISTTSFALNYYFSGLAVEGYHWTNISIHLFNGILVYFLTRLLLRHRLSGSSPFILPSSARETDILALFVGLFFIAHPIQTHGITYIVQRTGELATFFYFLSFVFFIKTTSGDKLKNYHYLGSLFSFLCGLWCKEIVYTAPAVFFLYYLLFIAKGWRDWSSISRGLKLLLPYLVLALASFYSTHVVEIYHQQMSNRGSYLAPGGSATEGDTWQWNRWGYLLTLPNAIIEYIKLLLLPLPSRLNVDVDFPMAKALWEWPTVFSVAMIALLLGSTVFLLKKDRLVAFGILWFFITLSPEGIVFALDEVMVCYRLYLPGLAFYLLLVIFIHKGLQYLVKRVKQESFTSRAWAVETTVLSLVLFSYCIGTYESNKVWETELTLWEDTVRKSPAKARPHYNLAVTYYRMGLYDKAETEFLKAIEICDRNPHPKDGRIRALYSHAYFLLGDIHLLRDEYAQAISTYKKGLEIDNQVAQVHINLGMAYYYSERLEEATKSFRQALLIDPNNFVEDMRLGLWLKDKKDFSRALECLERVRPLDVDIREIVTHLIEDIKAQRSTFDSKD